MFYDDSWKDVPCKIWRGATNGKGYGTIYLNGKHVYIHRAVWEAANGPIPDGMFMCHKCDVELCYEVMHLFLGTNTDNMRDASAKGRLLGRDTPHGEDNGASKLTEDDVRMIRRKLALGEQVNVVAREYGITRHMCRYIRDRVYWQHVV